MKKFLVRDACDYNVVYFIIELEDEKQWDDAKEYMEEIRDNNDDCESDSEIMEEYWQQNNIPYNIIYMPNDELYL